MSEPFVSVVIPVWNGKRFLAEAVESVLNQTYPPHEVIVVDDGSTDGSAEVAKSFGALVRCYFQIRSGAATARNHGVELSQGNFIAFLDADDFWVKDKLARQMKIFLDHPESDMVLGQVRQFYSCASGVVLKEESAIAPGFLPGAMLIKRSSFFRAGKFSTQWRVGEFIDWYLRAEETGLKSFLLPHVVLMRRIHDANMGIRERASRSDYVKIVKASLDRRRKGGAEKEQ
jgi:glycosyltransferase involved in cell wall biosynthesis